MEGILYMEQHILVKIKPFEETGINPYSPAGGYLREMDMKISLEKTEKGLLWTFMGFYIKPEWIEKVIEGSI